MPQITSLAAGWTNAARDRFLKTLAAVPDDKLDWSPAPDATTARQIAAHCAGAARYFLPVLRGEAPPSEEATYAPDVPREHLIDEINASSDAMIAAIESLPDSRLDEIVDLPWDKMPLAVVAMLPAGHLDEHAAQIDYLQLCWGDKEFHY